MLNSATKYIAKHEQKLITAGPADPRSCNRNGHIRIEHKINTRVSVLNQIAGYGGTALSVATADS